MPKVTTYRICPIHNNEVMDHDLILITVLRDGSNDCVLCLTSYEADVNFHLPDEQWIQSESDWDGNVGKLKAHFDEVELLCSDGTRLMMLCSEAIDSIRATLNLV